LREYRLGIYLRHGAVQNTACGIIKPLAENAPKKLMSSTLLFNTPHPCSVPFHLAAIQTCVD